MSDTNYQIIKTMSKTIVEYLEGEKKINEDALKAYNEPIITDNNSEIRVMREREAIKLRHSITELSRYIEVIKRMYPNK